MKNFREVWNNQPTTVIDVGIATLVLIGIYIVLLSAHNVIIDRLYLVNWVEVG